MQGGSGVGEEIGKACNTYTNPEICQPSRLALYSVSCKSYRDLSVAVLVLLVLLLLVI